ncbi:MAG TPA: glycoside hydrolase domain-containing protein, partial [Cytophagaceae bacterium]
MNILPFVFLLLISPILHAQHPLADAIRPMIGSEGEGNVFVGAAIPFGMVKPGPDCSYHSNSGHTPLNKNSHFLGISHTHVSGTGGGPKYGNILITPSTSGDVNDTNQILRQSEFARAGYYTTRLQKSNIKVEVTSTHSVAFHNYTFPNPDSAWIAIDLGHYLGKSDNDSKDDEQQKFVGSELEIVSPTEVRGYTRVEGGWNKGAAYTVYFFAEFNTPIIDKVLLKNGKVTKASIIVDNNTIAKALLRFRPGPTSPLSCKFSISFISTGKAQENMQKELPSWDFQSTLELSKNKWEKLLSTITIQEKDANKRSIFYTSLYHLCLMPVNRTGENPQWKSSSPYYDDFYAIWDTYRTSFPLLTILDESRVRDIVNSLIGTYVHTGYLPDARSGNDNGLTQGGSNADVVIADAFAKNVKGIDYELGLKAMLKNAESDPGSFHRKIGRGGILEYQKLGYVPYTHERSATRTVEYSLCDFAIAQLAKGLSKNDLSATYIKRSNSWKNLWRDTLVNGTRGFIWPKEEMGKWVDSTMQVKFSNKTWKFEKNKDIFTPASFGWGWEDVFYEGNSHHYSLHIPHDVKGLIEKSGGAKLFEARLDTFFSK